MSDPSARITRLATPVATPGNCGICGKDQHPKGFADARLDFEFYGTFYLCYDCVGEYSRLFGYVGPEDIVGLRDVVDAQNAELNTLRQAVLGLESTVDNLAGELSRRSSVTDAVTVIDPMPHSLIDDPVVQPDAGLTDLNVTEPVESPTEPADGTTEPTDEQRRDNLLDTSAADELLGL